MFVEGVGSQGLASSQGHTNGDVNHKGFTPRSRQNSGLFNRDDHNAMIRSLHNGRRPPQRSRTTHENIQTGPQVLTIMMASSHLSQPRHHTQTALTPAQVSAAAASQETKAQSASVSTLEQPSSETSDSVAPLAQLPRRPKLGPPRRSYSVTDYEPVPPEQRPAVGALTLTTLPSEIHFAIFDFLDPIDATCLGLTNRHLYAIHRRMHGSVPLSVRRDGPNELEWAWHRAAYPTPSMSALPLCPSSSSSSSSPSSSPSAAAAAVAAVAVAANDDKKTAAGHLAALRVRGKGLCRKCGVSRCELHKHIKEWMPAEYEYCSVRDMFVHTPGEEARPHCYMSNPTNSTRCGRHRVRRNNKMPMA